MGRETLRASIIYNGVNTGVSNSVYIVDSSVPTPVLNLPTVSTLSGTAVNPNAGYPFLTDGLIWGYDYRFNMSGLYANGRTLTIKARPFIPSVGGLVELDTKIMLNNTASFNISLTNVKTGWVPSTGGTGNSIEFLVFEGNTQLLRWYWHVFRLEPNRQPWFYL